MKHLLSLPFKIFRAVFSWFLRQSPKRKLVIIVLLVGVLFLIFRSQAQNGKSQYLTEFPKRESITEIVTETGNIVTSARVDVYSTTTGVIDEMYVTNGSEVRVGEVLFYVRSTATEQEKATARANYLSAKSTLDTAHATQLTLQATLFAQWDVFKNLAEGDKYEDGDGNPKEDNRNLPEFLVQQKEWLAAEANYKNQAQKIAQAQAATSAGWEAYQSTLDSKIVSPIAGRIYNLSSIETDFVSAKTVVGAEPVMIVADLSNIRIKVELNEVDIPKIEAGQLANLKIDALQGKEYTGRVYQVDTIGSEELGVVSYNAYLSVLEADPSIKPGMTVKVDIEVAKKENVLTVSSSAVRPYEGKRAVQIVDPETKKPKFIPVEIGLRGNGRTEILSGIDENTEIISALTNDQVERKGGIFGQ